VLLFLDGIDDGVGADSLDSTSGCMFVIPGVRCVRTEVKLCAQSFGRNVCVVKDRVLLVVVRCRLALLNVVDGAPSQTTSYIPS
jgi:hypothetical protein